MAARTTFPFLSSASVSLAGLSVPRRASSLGQTSRTMVAVSTLAGLLLLLAAVSFNDAAVKLGKLIKPCSIKDPKLNDCLTAQGQALLPHLIPGVKEWGIPPLDPLKLPHMQMQNGGKNSVGISLNITNSSHFAFKDMKLTAVTFDPDTLNMVFKLHFPAYSLQGAYKVQGRILLLPVWGNGFANITFYSVDATNNAKCEIEERGGKKYLKINQVVNTFETRSLTAKLENLFNNKQLSDTMNNVINQNPLEMLNDIKQPTQDIYSELYHSILSRMFSKIPLNQLFRDYE